MKGKTHNRFAAVFLALVMMLTSVSISMFIGLNADAAAGTYTFVAGEATGDKAFASGAKNGQKVNLTDYFTLHCGAKTALNDGKNQSKKTFDGVELQGRLNFGSTSSYKDRTDLIEFTTEGPATVKVWWVQGGGNKPSENKTGALRHVVILSNSGASVASSADDQAYLKYVDDLDKAGKDQTNSAYISTFKLTDSGTYFLGNSGGNNYFFKVEVEEEPAGAPIEFKEYLLEGTDVAVADKGTLTTATVEKDGFNFDLLYSGNSKIENKNKDFIDGYKGTRRINFGGTASTGSNAIKFTTTNPATIRVWWAVGDKDRQITILDSAGKAVATTSDKTIKDEAMRSTFKVNEPGTYYLGNSGGNNYIFKVLVRYGNVPLNDWSTIADPVINSVKDNGNGKMIVNVSAQVGEADAELVTVTMFDESGNEVGTTSSAADAKTHDIEFSPKKSGNYTFKAAVTRGTDKKESAMSAATAFVLPLSESSITSAYNSGNGSITLEWTNVPEATNYKVSWGEAVITKDDKGNDVISMKDGTVKTGLTKADETTYTVSGLTANTKYAFSVVAVRNDEEGKKPSAMKALTATAASQQKWSSMFFGPSTSSSKNKSEGDLNEDGKVTLSATGGGGKLTPAEECDGITYYYVTVPNSKNFTLRAKVTDISIDATNNQAGFGLVALDKLPSKPNTTERNATNQYMLAVGKIEYHWDFDSGKQTFETGVGVKYTMQHGIGINERIGLTPTDLKSFTSRQYPLETGAVDSDLNSANKINSIGENADYGHFTEFIFEIQRNNTGYFLSYYTPDGTLVKTQKFYDRDALSKLDTDNVYVGLFASREATATFSDVELTTIEQSEDKTPVEERPVEIVVPRANITSASVANSPEYTLMMTPNVNGKVSISVNDKVVASDLAVEAKKLLSHDIELSVSGKNVIKVVLTPDKDQGYDEYTKLESTDPYSYEIVVNYNTAYENQNNLYVAPDGKSNGNGGPDYPLDIFTAVNVVKPGQTIVVMEGTYKIDTALRIERGIDGTSDKPIKMIADPDAKTRPVFDFMSKGTGIRHGGNFWYFRGFDVTGSANGSTGFRVCGSNNTLDSINVYGNGNTGVQISAFRDSSDPRELWPHDNLILNCTSYENADAGFQDADGFAAKLTVGDGNVFDGCVAYHNADDGWDLFAKVATGEIGAVTIKNCVAYENGRLPGIDKQGDGNGFKLGGSDLKGGHKLINSISFNNYANGITSNSCPNVEVTGCTSYGNKGSNISLYSKNTDKAYVVKDLISYKGGSADKIEDSKSNVIENAHLNGEGITDETFVSLEFKGVTRKDNGTVDLGDFLKLKDTVSGGADFDKEGGSTPSENVDPIVPDENLPAPKPDTPTTPDNPGSSGGTVGTVTNPSTSDKDDVEFENSETNIKVTAPAGAFEKPDEIKFNVVPVAEETKDNQFTFDLTFTDKDGNKVQPKTAVTVRIPVPEALKGKTVYVYHVENDGKYTEISCKIEDGMVVFSATSFSKYIITSEKLTASEPAASDTSGESKPTDSSVSGSGSTDDGNSNNPSTGAAIPFTGAAAVIVGAAVTIFITKRKRG